MKLTEKAVINYISRNGPATIMDVRVKVPAATGQSPAPYDYTKSFLERLVQRGRLVYKPETHQFMLPARITLYGAPIQSNS